MSAPISTPTAQVREFTAELVVRSRTSVADGVVLLDLADPSGAALPRWEPGAHIDLCLENGLTRQYSLCGDFDDHSIWRIGVLLDPNSRGGSKFVHEQLREGCRVRVRGPRNHFQLVEAPRYRFIAGGIGITPILAMVEQVHRAGQDWTLLYGGRTRASMAFADELATRFPGRVTIWPQDERGLLDLETALKDPADDTLVYCCGPEGLLTAVEQHCAHWPAGVLHVERFAAKQITVDDSAALDRFEVVCRRSGVTIEVAAHESILERLEAAGVPITGSCYEGICGTCEARVLEGSPLHRDSVLNDAERDSGSVMMVCVSGSRGERLVLDL
ncbi:PDR/VanB family oxidoreductase [uncultured Mycolicibacterium sp.]|uniref:PDR/VanB family oxidoreductase n=1 Tax=uncultured Mycolicibacterium sp. TaxID=2320817 RepID=UPI00260A3E64|nr:PDR/VanB family oxidoreductase [uncultured Mycolicibacterium sp.]